MKTFYVKLLGTLTVIVLLSSPLCLRAQKTSGGLGYFSAGFHHYDFGAVNQTLNANGIPVMDEQQVAFGGGGFGIINNLILGGEGYSFRIPEASNTAYNLNAGGGLGVFHIGYVVLNARHILVFPMLGIGGSNMNLRIYENSQPDFASVAADPKRGSELTMRTFVLNPSISAFVYPGQRKVFFVGAKVSYVASPGKSRWEMNEARVANGPGSNLSGAAIQLVIGAGGLTR
jgi:hypothetical protein